MTQQKKTHVRWFILALLFVATTLLYIDRAALGIMAPYLQETIGWTEKQYGYITSSFMIGYAICFLLMGRFVDRVGTHRGYAISMGLWSVAQLAHALVASWTGFAVSRFALSVGQSGNFPAAIKTVAEWFPRKERALAVGIFNGGANVGTMIAPLVIPALVLLFDSWRVAFVWTLPVALVWIVCWLNMYARPEQHKKVNRAEMDYILSDAEDAATEKVSYGKLLSFRATWAILVGKFIADPIWWFYLFWGAKYLHAKFGLNLSEIGLPFFAIYLFSWGGGVALGWLSSRLLRTGSLNRGRKLSMLACAVCALPVMFVPHTDHVWVAVALIAAAAGGHCGWSANIFSLMSDVFPKKVTASVSGLGGFAGALGGVIAPILIGAALEGAGVEGYVLPFTVAAFGYFFALGAVQWLLPRIRPLKI
ncbi:MAG: MFS transporter [Tannerella sp.]|jgi:ACS family hexuronate transporter-like MFS transporter|nr:MFS transporter [Tannerella sp.]